MAVSTEGGRRWASGFPYPRVCGFRFQSSGSGFEACGAPVWLNMETGWKKGFEGSCQVDSMLLVLSGAAKRLRLQGVVSLGA